jgi:carotenoid cleavage dioxygenase
VIGEIPKRLSGVYLRNTQNAPLHEPLGTYHAFDGDGMLHLMSFDNGRCEYRNRYIRTAGLMEEQQAGHALYAGLIDKPALAQRPGWGARGGLKDTSATDVIVHAGKALTMFYQCGEPYRLDARTLAAQGVSGWGAQVLPDGGLSAHGKVDLRSGDLLFFNYGKQAPYMHYGEVDAGDQLVHYVPVQLPGPRLPHDMAFTEHYAILNDFPLHWDETLLAQGKHKLSYYADKPSRLAVVPRRCAAAASAGSRPRPPMCCTGLMPGRKATRSSCTAITRRRPCPRPATTTRGKRWGRALRPHAVRMAPEPQDRPDARAPPGRALLEFGMINAEYLGRPYRYSYNMLAHTIRSCSMA